MLYHSVIEYSKIPGIVKSSTNLDPWLESRGVLEMRLSNEEVGMADKCEYLEELEQALEGMSIDGLRLIAEFAAFLKKYGQNELQERAGGQRQDTCQKR